MEDQFSRTRMLFGQAGVDALSHARVAVFGVGGVGGYVVEVLARSGVGCLHLFDADKISLSNLNRQIVAYHSTLGCSKVDVACHRVLDINPQCKVVGHEMFYLPENADQVSLTDFDYVVDCIDTMAAKLELIRRCHRDGVRLIAAMGAANKIDATRVKVCSLWHTKMDPMAKIIRKKLRREGLKPDIKVVCSEEKPLVPFFQPDKEDSSKRFTPASNAFVPAAFGIAMGGEVIVDLLRMGNVQIGKSEDIVGER